MGILEDIFGGLFGDNSTGKTQRMSHVDAEGHEYEWNWLTGSWQERQGLFGPETELDFLGNPKVDRDWLGDPVRDTNWMGDQMHAASGEPLFRLTEEEDD
jgi:hypothetical protein